MLLTLCVVGTMVLAIALPACGDAQTAAPIRAMMSLSETPPGTSIRAMEDRVMLAMIKGWLAVHVPLWSVLVAALAAFVLSVSAVIEWQIADLQRNHVDLRAELARKDADLIQAQHREFDKLDARLAALDLRLDNTISELRSEFLLPPPWRDRSAEQR